MANIIKRRRFIADVGRGAFLVALGPSLAIDMGLATKSSAEELDARLHFGEWEPLVCELQETPIDRLQPSLAKKLRDGVALKTLVGAAALANARTFGGEDYIGFHTFMALSPAYRMASLMSPGAEALPVFKVLYRNTSRIHSVGGRASEALKGIGPGGERGTIEPNALYHAVRAKDVSRAEQLLALSVKGKPRDGLDALLPAVQDQPEVHRTVLPFRAWDMVDLVGEQHALTLLRQSLHYCLMQSGESDAANVSEQAAIIVKLFDECGLHGKSTGAKSMDDQQFEQLSGVIASGSPMDAAHAAASALAEGFSPDDVGEAVSLAANSMLLRDGGRLPIYEDVLKPPGCVHGDSVGVHASDAANAWRHLAKVSSGKNQITCLLIGAWQIARDRIGAQGLMNEALPSKYHVKEIRETSEDALVSQLKDAIHHNLQGHATAIVQRYGELSYSPERLFKMMVNYAVSEDGALHAEKYFHTSFDDFFATRPTWRWRHLMALARVTASEYGAPAAGQAEARDLLGVGPPPNHS